MMKSNDKWEAYKAAVPGLAAALQPVTPAVEDSDLAFKSFLSQLPGEIAEQLGEAQQDPADAPWSKGIEHSWCLCDMPEGEFPRVYVYNDLRGLVEAVVKREGQETSVWALYGVPLRLTKPVLQGDKRVRYLLLPNQYAAVVSEKMPYNLVAQSALPANLELEDTGWLGDPSFLQAQPFFTPGYTEVAEEPAEFTEDDDEEPDDDDEGEMVS